MSQTVYTELRNIGGRRDEHVCVFDSDRDKQCQMSRWSQSPDWHEQISDSRTLRWSESRRQESREKIREVGVRTEDPYGGVDGGSWLAVATNSQSADKGWNGTRCVYLWSNWHVFRSISFPKYWSHQPSSLPKRQYSTVHLRTCIAQIEEYQPKILTYQTNKRNKIRCIGD